MVGRFAIKHRVSVWGKEHKITVYQKSKSVWEAVGDYMGVNGRTEGAAVKRWWWRENLWPGTCDGA